MLSCFAQRREGFFSGSECEAYKVKDGKVVCMYKAVHAVVPLPGFILHLYRNGDELYYVRTEETENVLLKAGLSIPAKRILQEVNLPKEVQNNKIIRWIAAGGAGFLVAIVGEKETSTLYRIDFNSGKISRKKGIIDVVLHDGAPVVLVKSEKGYAVRRNNFTVPLTFHGKPKFGSLFEGRILVISEGEKKELVDLGIMKNVHGFGGGRGDAEFTENTLYIEVMDVVPDKMEMLVFYKVFLNGIDSGRTDCGPAGQTRKYSAKLAEDQYHIVRLERWELNIGKNEYERANNINQPQSLKIFLPQHRAVKLIMARNKKGYISSIFTMQK